jgi:DNA (cytosine-5)-methyltransferase 1
MKFGSVCSGIEAASVAWHPLGWKAAWLSEIEPFPSAVLAHHYPDVPNLGDMTALPERILSGEVEAPDVFCGGTPCQAFSVAGLRNSLDDARGNLSLTFVGIANAIDTVRTGAGQQPAIIFWENVPGVLSTKDNAFGCFLAGLAGEDGELEPSGGKWTNAGCVFGPQRAVAWRVLDAQYFGVAQRRRRVFVVASARDDFDPVSVLFELDGVRRDSAPSRQAGETVTPTIRAGATNGGPGHGARSGGSKDELIVPVEIGPSGGRLTDLNPTLDTRAKDGPIRNQLAGAVMQPVTTHRMVAFGEYSDDDGTASAMKARDYKDATDLVAQPITYGIRTANTSSPCTDRGMNAVAQPIAFHPTQDPISSTDGTTHGLIRNQLAGAVMHPAYAIQGSMIGRNDSAGPKGDGINEEVCFTQNTIDRHAVFQPIAFHPTQDPISSTDGTTHGLGCGSSGGQASVAVSYGIRTANTSNNGWGIQEEVTHTLDCAQSVAVAQPIGIFQDSEYGVAKYDNAGTLRAGRIPEHQMVMQPIGCFKGGQGSAAGSIGYDEHVSPTLNSAFGSIADYLRSADAPVQEPTGEVRSVLLLDINGDDRPYKQQNLISPRAVIQLAIARKMVAASEGTEFSTAHFISLGVETSVALRALTQMQRRGLVTMSRSKRVGAHMQHWFVFNEKHLDIDLDAIEASGNAA